MTIPNWYTVHHPESWSVDIMDNYNEEKDKWQKASPWVVEVSRLS